jgi:hypothetical protein
VAFAPSVALPHAAIERAGRAPPASV